MTYMENPPLQNVQPLELLLTVNESSHLELPKW